MEEKKHQYQDTICACGHWFEEHDEKDEKYACDSCAGNEKDYNESDVKCPSFVFDPEQNTHESIDDRGGEHDLSECYCASCEHRRSQFPKTCSNLSCGRTISLSDHLTNNEGIDCTICNRFFCDNCYDTSKGDGCHCHDPANQLTTDPACCPYCGGENITTYMVLWSATSKEDSGNHATLNEHQCLTCEGRSFWT